MESPATKSSILSTLFNGWWRKVSKSENQNGKNPFPKAEQMLEATQQEMAMILDNTEEFFLVVDKNYKVLTSNQSAVKNVRRLLGGDIQKGSSVLDLSPVEYREALDAF